MYVYGCMHAHFCLYLCKCAHVRACVCVGVCERVSIILTTNPADAMLRVMVYAASCTPLILPVTKLPISKGHHSPPTTNTPGMANQRNSFHSTNDSVLKPITAHNFFIDIHNF